MGIVLYETHLINIKQNQNLNYHAPQKKNLPHTN
jgi:hypothetical protein